MTRDNPLAPRKREIFTRGAEEEERERAREIEAKETRANAR